MFERFTEEARKVVLLAREEAATLRHNRIDTGHLLLGLCRVQDGVATPVLAGLDVTVERVRASIVRLVGSGEAVTSAQFPFTPRAKEVMWRALQETLNMRHDFIGPEDLLLALLPDGTTSQCASYATFR